MPRLRSRASLTAPSAPPPTASSSRPRRNTTNKAPPAAVVQRSSPEESRHSLNLTVKASPGKLREATGGSVSTAVSSRNIVAGKRARNSRVVRELDSDDEEDDDDAEEVDAMDVDEPEDDDDAEGEEDEDMDAEGEEDDDAEVTPAPRIVVPSNKNAPVKQKVAQDSVEAKELTLDDDDDDELSELDSELEGEDEDAEGEDDDAEGEEDDEIAVPNDDEEMDSDEELSRDQTPDLSKMTRRQQAMVVQGADESLMALSNEAQKKKHLTAEEITSRRAEMARRRKNLSEKRNEEEKVCFVPCAHPAVMEYAVLCCANAHPRRTPSTASSRNSRRNAGASPCSRTPRTETTTTGGPRRRIRCSCATGRRCRGLRWRFPRSGWRVPREAC
jgi:Ino eighty subunit 2